MTMPDLPADWASTRSTLQAYGQAITALPRAAGVPDGRWSHVSMTVSPTGLVSAPTPLGDGTELVGMIDLSSHEIVLSAGDHTMRTEIISGPSSRSIGEAMISMASQHGSDIEVETDRFGGSDELPYDADHATAFHAAALVAVAAFEEMNLSVPGETTGPHLWPHGFDIATEWYSANMVPHGDGEASAQIAVGFYPSNDSYFYANPWPFEESWAESVPVEGGSWHIEDWQGLVLPAKDLSKADIVALGTAVHQLARDTLSRPS